MMKINKGASVGLTVVPTDEELSEINKFSKRELSAAEVFTFSVLLCDNEVDRDYERFTVGALEELSALFLGKTGISDHQWSSKEQIARIYRAEVKADGARLTAGGEPYTYLKAYAYMLRTASGAKMIAEIEGGIKKEVSIGCSVSSSVCSICGESIGSVKCGHVRGREYDGKTCCAILSCPSDAYEWSFVAVPAQREAGVMKRFGPGDNGGTLTEYIEKSGKKAFGDEFQKLCREAEMGRRYIKELREDVVRLGLLSGCGLEAKLLRSASAKMDEEELMGFKLAFEKKADSLLPPLVQLGACRVQTAFEPETEYLV